MTADQTAAVVGTAGGVGTTRLTVELGAALAAADRDVALLDTAYATQGLAGYVPGRIDPDVTALTLARADAAESASADLSDALSSVSTPGDGRLVALPSYAPFERLARAKAPAAARAFEDLLGDAADRFDHVLVDTPPVATNPAVAAVTAADRVCVVTEATDRGVDALQRTRGRLADVGTEESLVVANRTDDAPPDADHAVPAAAVSDATEPTVGGASSPFAEAVVSLAESLFDADLDVGTGSGVVDAARRRLSE